MRSGPDPNTSENKRNLPLFVRLLVLAGWACEAVLKGHRGCVLCLTNLDDTRIASGSEDGSIRIWDTVDGTCERVLEDCSDNWVRSVGSIGAGRVVSAGSEDGSVRIWDTTDGTCESVLEGHSKVVLSVACLGDGSVATGGQDGQIYIWTPNGRMTTCGMVLGETSGKGVIAVASLGDGRIISASQADRHARVWGANGTSAHVSLTEI